MSTINHTPARLNISLAIDDDLSLLLDFDVDLTGYTFSAKIVESDDTETTITVTNTDLTNGKITLSSTASSRDTANLEADTYAWYLTWTTSSTDRRVLAGDFTIVEKA